VTPWWRSFCMKPIPVILLGISLFQLLSCSNSDEEIKEVEPYKGPIQEAYNVEVLHSDSAVVIVRLEASQQFIYESGDQRYPEGIFIEFFDQKGELTTILKGEEGMYHKEEDLYQVKGNVEVDNIRKKQKLNTEELFWKPKDEEVYTEKFVTIETEGEVLKGEGLIADQDFSTYRITKPTGRITIEDE